MFTGIIKKASLLKKIATILNNLFHSISMSIRIDDENAFLHILMVTTCKTMLLDVLINFDEWNHSEMDENLAFSVNAKHFLESFNTIRANDSVKLETNPEQLTIEIQSDECTERTFLWITPTQTFQVTNAPEYGNAIKVKDLNFQKLCKALNNASTELTIRGNENRISLRADLENMYGREVEFGDREALGDDFQDIYSTEHFLHISKISTLSDNLYFFVRKDQPLCVEARFGAKGLFKVLIKSKTLLDED